jgi:hypothetical protein
MFAEPGATEADVEDILGRDLYIRVVNAAYRLKATQRIHAKRPVDAPARVVEEVNQHFRNLPPEVPEFNHFAPAAYLLANASSFDGKPLEAALDHFEKLFMLLNSLL